MKTKEKIKEKILAIIPARSGSKRILNKNIRPFNGKPLIYYTIKVALESGIFDRVIVDTDSPEYAKIARKYGAETPFLRPKELAKSGVSSEAVMIYLLKRLKDEGYVPDIVTLLQTTSPLREVSDILDCHKIISNPNVPSVCTVYETHPWFLYLDSQNKIILVNKEAAKSTQTEQVRKGYAYNGCIVYMIKISEFLKTRSLVNKNTVAIISPSWRSIDLDHPEDWVLAEVIQANKSKIENKLKSFR